MTSATGSIFDIQRYCIHDGPGIRTTVFFKGCPLRCAWCHNPEGLTRSPGLMVRPNLCIGCLSCLPACPQGAIRSIDGLPETDRTRCTACGACAAACPTGAREIAGKEMTPAEVMAVVERDLPFYEESGGGVTFSGGEALLQVEFLRRLLVECHRMGIHTTLDTSGYAPWSAFESIRHDVDLFLFDLKGIDEPSHRRYTGVSNRRILDNLQALSCLGHSIIVRSPLIPGVNDSPPAVQALGEFLQTLPHLDHLDLIPYHRIGVEKYRRLGVPYPFEEAGPPSQAEVEAAAAHLRSFNLTVHIGG
jgi:pyruvate formate lyase activating enzyme